MNTEKLSVLSLLESYKGWVKNGDIQFLKKAVDKNSVLTDVDKLIDIFRTANNELIQYRGNTPDPSKKSLSDFLDWHTIHQYGTDLWKKLASKALNFIQPGSKGNSTLFEFLKEATRFEDLLYGLEPFYRDHTLHSIWVYLIGEHLLRGPLRKIYNVNNFNWYLFNDIEIDQKKYNYHDLFVEYSRRKQEDLLAQVDKKKDAIWCVIALCHDLGYSLEKLNRLNERVQKVLSFYNISNHNEIGYSLDIEHQYLVSQFLELMAMDVRMVPSQDYEELEFDDPETREVLIKYWNNKKRGIRVKDAKKLENDIEEKVIVKCYRDDSTYWRLCRAVEKKQHGILSAYLVYKILGLFAESSNVNPSENWGLNDEEAVENIILGDILFAITQHSFDFAQLYELNSLADLLIVADELEEFSRYGRQILSRKYFDTTAEAIIKFDPPEPEPGQNIQLVITYFADEQLEQANFYMFFKRKAEELCRKYSLEQTQNNESFCKIESIKMIAKRESGNETEELFFILYGKENKNEGFLPETKINNRKAKARKFKLKCVDDNIYFKYQGKEISFDDWFKEYSEKR
ncbi:MAG: hypothetical protein KKH84_03730 [Proteobacteria bacterium]|nr:hypothetical protein [Pseudomonadota bacterium]MBU4389118.1 hypothetical protein [Pseudomonadota bacterium]MBU4420099.1 hypothetical protein [Pseudomonadota bacterium]MBU4504692.1 hypothetical protein [Pseudomonadota bacterium]MCG2830094.1 hypothetical protein [Desulfobacteraceae bacterium]